MTNSDQIANLEVSLARVQAEIDNTFAPEDLHPSKAQMKRYNDKLDALTSQRRKIKAQIADIQSGGETEREFASDIENRAAMERFAIAKQRQLDGVLSSLGRRF